MQIVEVEVNEESTNMPCPICGKSIIDAVTGDYAMCEHVLIYAMNIEDDEWLCTSDKLTDEFKAFFEEQEMSPTDAIPEFYRDAADITIVEFLGGWAEGQIVTTVAFKTA